MLLARLKRYHAGAINAVSSKELEAAFAVSGKKIRDAVNALRQDGEPVCSDKRGYFYAITEEEVNHSVRQLGNRIKQIARAQRGLMTAAAKFVDTGQTSLALEVVRN